MAFTLAQVSFVTSWTVARRTDVIHTVFIVCSVFLPHCAIWTEKRPTMQLTDLKQLTQAGKAPALEVHSIDPSIYLIFCCDDDNRAPIKGSNGDNLMFRSRSKAFDALRDAGVRHADFVHRSAFDEMVGVGDGTPTEHRESIALNSLADAD